jgi:hypothetical protein
MPPQIDVLPQIGDKIRLGEDDGPCHKDDEGRVLDALSNGKLIVLCDKDKDCNPKGPFRCTIKKWEPARCSGKPK